jgi:hypothetical protein
LAAPEWLTLLWSEQAAVFSHQTALALHRLSDDLFAPAARPCAHDGDYD